MEQQAQQPWRILAIDDEVSVLETYQAILQATGDMEDQHSSDINDLNQLVNLGSEAVEEKQSHFDLTCVNSGEAGYQQVKGAIQQGTPFAVIYLDMRMPNGWDGLDTAIKVREVDPHVRIIMITAYADHSMTQIRSKIGVDFEFLNKPINREELSQLTRLHIENWERLKELERYREQLELLVERRTAELKLEADNHKQCGQARSFNPVGVNPTPARQASHRIENFGLAGVIPKTKHRGIKTAGRKRELNG